MSEDHDQVYNKILKKYQESSKLVQHPFFSENTGGVQFSLINKKVLPAPRDQGICRCCVHLTMTLMVGAMLALQTDIKNRLLRLFSYQHIIDCMEHKTKKGEDEKGCQDSTFQEVFNFLRSNGIVEDHVYPYLGEKGNCRDTACDKSDSSSRVKGKSKKHSDSPKTFKGKCEKRMSDEPKIAQESKRVRLKGNGEVKKEKLRSFDKIKTLIRRGPLAVSVPIGVLFNQFTNVDGEQKIFPVVEKSKNNPRSKSKSIKPDVPNVGEITDHAMLLIGYGKDEDTKRDFYLVLNSWPQWGFYGYGKIAVEYFSKEAEGFYIGSDTEVVYD